MLTRVTVLDRLEIDEVGNISIRLATYIEEGGVRIHGPSFHRSVWQAGTELPNTVDVPNAGTFDLAGAILARASQAQIVERLTALGQSQTPEPE